LETPRCCFATVQPGVPPKITGITGTATIRALHARYPGVKLVSNRGMLHSLAGATPTAVGTGWGACGPIAFT